MAKLARPVSFGPGLYLLALFLPLTSLALDLTRTEVQSFINQLEQDHEFDRAYIEAQLAASEKKQSIIDAISRPAEGVLTWGEYRNIFIQPERIEAGVRFYAEHKEALDQIYIDTGVPPQMILGIVGVESYYGRITGSYRVLDALTTLGFDYPPRAKFFRSELSHAFRLAREENIDLTEFMGSYAGAMGPPQFIPSSYRAYAVDGDGDGKRDLLNNWNDILASVANYFVEHNWRRDGEVATQAEDLTEMIEACRDVGVVDANVQLPRLECVLEQVDCVVVEREARVNRAHRLHERRLDLGLIGQLRFNASADAQAKASLMSAARELAACYGDDHEEVVELLRLAAMCHPAALDVP